MVRREEIAIIIDAQRETFTKQDSGFTRDALSEIPIADSFATIITGGIRRCGKSTLLLQLLRQNYQFEKEGMTIRPVPAHSFLEM